MEKIPWLQYCRGLHDHSPRVDGKTVLLNCSFRFSVLVHNRKFTIQKCHGRPTSFHDYVGNCFKTVLLLKVPHCCVSPYTPVAKQRQFFPQLERHCPGNFEARITGVQLLRSGAKDSKTWTGGRRQIEHWCVNFMLNYFKLWSGC